MNLGRLTARSAGGTGVDDPLVAMNALLAPAQAELEARCTAPRHPPVLVLGPPRSGTTLVSQLITATGLFSTISNFVARFWQAPAVGMTIARAMGILGELGTSSYRSVRGVAEGWDEPSEFGYFWSRFFDLGQPTHWLGEAERARVDRDGLRRAVAAMEAVGGKPMAFKNNTWFSFHADLLAETFPGTVLVVCRRDPFYVAQSLYRQRLELFGDAGAWWSVRPPEYDSIRSLAPIEQIAHQAVCIGRHMDESVARAMGARIVDASYTRVTSDPRGVVAEIAAAAGLDGANALADLPEAFETTDRVNLPDALATTLRVAIEDATARWR